MASASTSSSVKTKPKPNVQKGGYQPTKSASASPPAKTTTKPTTQVASAPAKTIAKPVKPAPFKITTPSTRARYLKMLIYGEYGAGKTFLAGTSVEVEEMQDVLLIDAESGDLTLDSDEYDFVDIDHIRVTNFPQVARIHEYLKAHCRYRDDPSKEATERLLVMERILKDDDSIEAPTRYRTVIIDSLTEIDAYSMNRLLGVDENTALDLEVEGAEWAEYKKNMSMMQRVVRGFRDLPMNVIVTCARSYVQDERKRFNYTPRMTGQLSNLVQGFMDVVGYLVIGKGEDGTLHRRLHVQPIGRYAAKCRFSTFKGNHFDDPTMMDILEAVGLKLSTKSKLKPKPKK